MIKDGPKFERLNIKSTLKSTECTGVKLEESKVRINLFGSTDNKESKDSKKIHINLFDGI